MGFIPSHLNHKTIKVFPPQVDVNLPVSIASGNVPEPNDARERSLPFSSILIHISLNNVVVFNHTTHSLRLYQI